LVQIDKQIANAQNQGAKNPLRLKRGLFTNEQFCLEDPKALIVWNSSVGSHSVNTFSNDARTANINTPYFHAR